MEKINLYINADIIMEDISSKKLNQNFFDALSFMYEKYSHLLEFYIFTKNEEEVSSQIKNIPFTFVKKKDIPTQINKLYHLIDNNYDYLCEWERLTGKGIAYDFKRSSKEQWAGFKLTSKMTKEEFIEIF